MSQQHTYAAIASDFALWNEFVNTDGAMTEQEFDALTVDQKVALQVEAFGEEGLGAGKVAQYTVKAVAETGEWIGDPEYVGVVTLADWHKKVDTAACHFDTYEVPADDGVSTITRAIEVVWQE